MNKNTIECYCIKLGEDQWCGKYVVYDDAEFPFASVECHDKWAAEFYNGDLIIKKQREIGNINERIERMKEIAREKKLKE